MMRLTPFTLRKSDIRGYVEGGTEKKIMDTFKLRWTLALLFTSRMGCV
jgi:hypothetical protein